MTARHPWTREIIVAVAWGGPWYCSGDDACGYPGVSPDGERVVDVTYRPATEAECAEHQARIDAARIEREAAYARYRQRVAVSDEYAAGM